MILERTQAKVRHAAVVIALCATSAACAQSAPSAQEILSAARINQMTQEAELNGQLRVDRQREPFVVRLSDGVVRYRFSDPDQEIQLRFGDKQVTLTESRDGGRAAPVTPGAPLRDTSITYEDLSLPFLYWPNPRLIGEDTVRTRACWRIEVQAPRSGPLAGSQYGVVRVWVDKESGALLKMEGYDGQGRLAKRFEVISVQRIDGQPMLRSMRVEEFDPGSPRVARRTYLEIRR